MFAPPVVRRIDVSAGHCFFPRAASSWSPNVFVNNQNVVRKTDTYPTHCLHGDTGIVLSDKSIIKISKMAEHFKDVEYNVISCSENGNTLNSIVIAAFETKKSKIMVKLFFGFEYIELTEDHLVMLVGGSYKQAKDITEQDDIMEI